MNPDWPVVLKELKELSYVEIGSRNGDLSACLSHFARKVIVVEAEKPYCAALRARNLTVLCHRVTRENVALLPTADVYFWWMFPSLNLELARMVHSAIWWRATAVPRSTFRWTP